ncbi:MAG TPA: single-stranded DNA-binding protein [Cyanothece sp. UBA12306]|nr:single-stranded DNA-binding protein [Cyanothece sp. UBA12306]
MNSCVLMVKVIRPPELRYTKENQTPIAQMLVEFAGRRSEDPPSTLKVVGWGNLANEMQGNYQEGDHLIIEGRLSMNTFERPEGFKEKRAELVASHIYAVDGVFNSVTTSSSQDNVVSMDNFKSNATFSQDRELRTPPPPVPNPPATPSNTEEGNLDDIPF